MPPFQFTTGSAHETPTHPELEGQRVFVSGIADNAGEVIARGFARQRTRLVLHCAHAGANASSLADGAKALAAAVRLFAANIGADQAASERLGRAVVMPIASMSIVVWSVPRLFDGAHDEAKRLVGGFQVRREAALVPDIGAVAAIL